MPEQALPAKSRPVPRDADGFSRRRFIGTGACALAVDALLRA